MGQIEKVFVDFGDTLIKAFPNILSGIMVLIVFTIMGLLLRKLIRTRLTAKWKDTIVANFAGDVTKWIFIILGVIIALHFVGFGGIGSSILAGAGISAIIVGFAFKDIAENFLSGILLAVNRPFKKGDIIEMDKYKGPVRNLDLRVTHIRTADGRDIFIPNSMIVKNVLINYTKDGLIRQEFKVGLDTFDDLARAREVILAYFSKQKDVLPKPLPNMLIEEIGESSVVIKITFWVDILKTNSPKNDPNMGELIKSRVMREIKDVLLENGFNLPALIVEHKMYRENAPIQVETIAKKEHVKGSAKP